jgi:hypothetical protein
MHFHSSSHGKCNNNDRCECYKYSGTTRGDLTNYYEYSQQRAAWTGADCSLRTCPLAFSFSGHAPNGLSRSSALTADATANAVTIADISAYATVSQGMKIRVVRPSTGASQVLTVQSVAAGVITVYETITPLASYTTANNAVVYTEALENDVATRGVYDTVMGDFGQWDANNAHGLVECAGQGTCDRATGQCNCFPGYEGESCTRTTCPNSCSGHGICLASYRIAADYSQVYDRAWDSDKHFGCKCDVGFRGPDCSLQECPSDFDPLNGCGGGRCNTGGQYYARDGTLTDCPNRVLTSSGISAQTNLNSYEIDTSDCLTGEQRDCSGRGICDYQTGTCKCFSGFFGESCNIQTVLV